GRADGHAAANTRDDEDDLRGRSTLHKRSGQEQSGGEHHHIPPADDVGKAAGKKRTDEAADKERSDGETETVARRPAARHKMESLSQAVLGAVHSTAIIAEQEPADRRHRHDRSNEAHVCTLWARFRHVPLPRARLLAVTQKIRSAIA